MYLWKTLYKLRGHIIKAKKVLIFLDYDGTIVPITSTPQEVKLPKLSRTLLKNINHQHTISVGVVSGRSLEELKNQIHIPGLIYAGNHGLEWEINGKKHRLRNLSKYLRHLSRVKKILLHLVRDYPGVIIEDKRFTLAIHYRKIDRKLLSSFRTYLHSLLNPLLGSLPIRLSEGKKIYEIRPATGWTKGDFVEFVINKIVQTSSNYLVIYIGDDITDEDVFAKLSNIVSVKVGRGKTEAKYYLTNYQETILFLKWVLDTIQTN